MIAPFHWPWPRVLAHRGGGALAPENTLAAIDVGRAQGYRAIECDAMLAGDAVPVLIHDDTLERTTDGRGPVPAVTAAQLQRLDAGGWFDARFAGARVPLLAEAIAHCRSHGVWMNIEIKPARGHERQTGEVVAALVAAAFADAVPPPPRGLRPSCRVAFCSRWCRPTGSSNWRRWIAWRCIATTGN
jgi:glycerophosphoryl diester phosphodiesterase